MTIIELTFQQELHEIKFVIPNFIKIKQKLSSKFWLCCKRGNFFIHFILLIKKFFKKCLFTFSFQKKAKQDLNSSLAD